MNLNRGGTPHIKFEGIWSDVQTQLGTSHQVGATRLDFRSHSGSHQSSAWIQNPSSSWVWQKYMGKSDVIKGSSVRMRYSKILHISAPSDVHAEDNKSQTTPSIMGRFRQHHHGSFVSDTQSIPQSATVGTSYPHCIVAVGGLGLKAASDHCFAAYITSLLFSHELKLEI